MMSGSDSDADGRTNIMLHVGSPLSASEITTLQRNGVLDVAKYSKWEVSREEPWFQAISDIPCGLSLQEYTRLEGLFIKQLKGKGPVFVNKCLKQVSIPFFPSSRALGLDVLSAEVLGGDGLSCVLHYYRICGWCHPLLHS